MWRLCKPRLNQVLDEYLQVHKIANNTVKLTKRAWNQMVAYTTNIRINKFNRSSAEGIQAHWQGQTSNTTARIYRKSVSPVFSWSVEKGYLKENPFANIKTPRVCKRKVRVYSPAEFRALLEACDDLRWVAILLLAKTTGMRKSAIQNLCRTDIDFANETITVSEKPKDESHWFWLPKDREERKLPLIPSVANVLTEIVYSIPASQPYVLLKPPRYYHLIEMKRLGFLTDEMRLSPISNFDRTFRKIRKRAGVKGRFHDLRSTCLTGLADVLNPNELAMIAGHSDIKTTMRYVGMGRDTVNKARLSVIESMGALMTPSHAR